MEFSLTASGLHNSLTHSTPFSFPLIPSISPPKTTTKTTKLNSATKIAPLPTKSISQKRHSKSYLVRQIAIAEVQASSDFFSALQRFGETLKVQDLNVILRTFGNQSRWQDLSQLFDWMQQHGKISVSSYSSYIKFMGKSFNPTMALKIYNGIPDESTKANVYICNSVLSCLVRNRKFSSSIEMFHEMKRNGLLPDAITYSTLLAGCIKVEDGYCKASKLVQEMDSNGLKMDSVMYGTILAVCASNNQSEEALKYFGNMKDEGHAPNIFHYSSLLNAYSSNGDYMKAEKLLEDLKSSGLIPNKVILTTLLKVYVRGGLFEKSEELLKELEALGYAKDEMPYCLLMGGLAKAGRMDEARLIFKEMEEKCVKSDGYSHSIMISAFCRAGLLEEAKKFAMHFEEKYNKYDVVILNTMLCAYCRAGEMDNVMQTMKKMDELTITPNYNTFHILIKYFCKEKLYLLAYQTMEDMHKKGHRPEEELCSSLIFHLGKIKAYSEAFSVYNILRYSKRTMCKSLHEKIVHILIAGRLFKDAYVVVKDNADVISKSAIKKFAERFVKLGNINMINDVMKVIHGAGEKIDPRLFRIVIARYISEPQKKDLLVQLLQWMPSQGYVVDSSTRNMILKNSHLFGRQLIADILSRQHVMSKALKSK